MTTLLLDLGNSRFKYAQYHGASSQIVSIKSMPYQAQKTQEAIVSALPHAGVTILASSVRSPAFNEVLKIAVKNQGASLKIVDWRDCSILKTRYSQPETLGIDRYLAMIGALALFSAPFVVVDAGTAVTIDVVDRNAEHLGGYIHPGLDLARNSLLHGTDRLAIEQCSDESNTLPISTSGAICSATLIGWRAAIDGIIDSIAVESGIEYDVVLTGGQASLLGAGLKTKHTIDDRLVLAGLAHVAEQQA